MGYTNETTHFGIPLPLGSDLTVPMDYNEAFQKIDNATFNAQTSSATAVENVQTAIETAQNAVTSANNAVSLANSAQTSANTAVQTANDARNLVADAKQDMADAICSIVEASATAEYAHAVGSYFWYNDTLYVTTVEIPRGAQIVPNTNCNTTNVTSELLEISSGGSTEPIPNMVRYDAERKIYQYNNEGVWTDIITQSEPIEAVDVSFSDTIAKLGATDVQSAIVALKTLIDNLSGGGDMLIDFANRVELTETEITTSSDGVVFGGFRPPSGSTSAPRLLIDDVPVGSYDSDSMCNWLELEGIPVGTKLKLASANNTASHVYFVPYATN